jgi:uncharacterized membrane protein YkgB
MNTGYAVAALGILGVIVGAGMYAAAWHRTIGLGGVGLGVILLVAGIWLARNPPAKPAPQTQPQK